MAHPLKTWRDGQTPPASSVSVARSLGTSHSLVLEWEKGTRSPGVEFALRIEQLTNGVVPIEVWGYTRNLVDLMRCAVERRSVEEPSGEITVEREGFDQTAEGAA